MARPKSATVTPTSSRPASTLSHATRVKIDDQRPATNRVSTERLPAREADLRGKPSSPSRPGSSSSAGKAAKSAGKKMTTSKKSRSQGAVAPFAAENASSYSQGDAREMQRQVVDTPRKKTRSPPAAAAPAPASQPTPLPIRNRARRHLESSIDLTDGDRHNETRVDNRDKRSTIASKSNPVTPRKQTPSAAIAVAVPEADQPTPLPKRNRSRRHLESNFELGDGHTYFYVGREVYSESDVEKMTRPECDATAIQAPPLPQPQEAPPRKRSFNPSVLPSSPAQCEYEKVRKMTAEQRHREEWEAAERAAAMGVPTRKSSGMRPHMQSNVIFGDDSSTQVDEATFAAALAACGGGAGGEDHGCDKLPIQRQPTMTRSEQMPTGVHLPSHLSSSVFDESPPPRTTGKRCAMTQSHANTHDSFRDPPPEYRRVLGAGLRPQDSMVNLLKGGWPDPVPVPEAPHHQLGSPSLSFVSAATTATQPPARFRLRRENTTNNIFGSEPYRQRTRRPWETDSAARIFGPDARLPAPRPARENTQDKIFGDWYVDPSYGGFPRKRRHDVVVECRSKSTIFDQTAPVPPARQLRPVPARVDTHNNLFGWAAELDGDVADNPALKRAEEKPSTHDNLFGAAPAYKPPVENPERFTNKTPKIQHDSMRPIFNMNDPTPSPPERRLRRAVADHDVTESSSSSDTVTAAGMHTSANATVAGRRRLLTIWDTTNTITGAALPYAMPPEQAQGMVAWMGGDGEERPAGVATGAV